MTIYQTSVLTYLRDRGPQFIDWVASQPGQPELQIIGDMCPLAVRFLIEKLRGEMALYDKRSARYSALTDMLIEVNLPLEDDFRQRINVTATEFFLGKAPYRPN